MPLFSKLSRSVGPTAIRKAQEAIGKNPDKVNRMLDRAAVAANQRTGGKHRSKIDMVSSRARKAVLDMDTRRRPIDATASGGRPADRRTASARGRTRRADSRRP